MRLLRPRYLLCFLCGILLDYSSSSALVKMQDVVTVSAEEGLLRGKATQTVLGTKYYSFRGIPYAKAPIGRLRFKPPEPSEHWQGIRDALEFGSQCVQFDLLTGNLTGEEDCLFMNIYTPQLPQDQMQRLPVMFWIHGGGFAMGSGDDALFGPDFLIDNDVIVVTFNYRVGVLGFLSTEDSVVSGNMGLKDILYALKWINRNIHSFGGDSKNITVFGLSAGAAAAQYLLMMPQSVGLFQRMIALSGSALNPWAFCSNPRERAFRLGRSLGVITNSSQQLVEYLRTVEARDLVQNMYSALSDIEKKKIMDFAFVPSIEPNNDSAVLTAHPAQILFSGNYTSVPYITGFASREGIFVFQVSKLADNGEALANLDKNFEETISLDIPVSSDKRNEAAHQIRQFYFGDRGISDTTVNTLVDFLGDIYFNAGVAATLKAMSTKQMPVYQYQFSFEKNIPPVPRDVYTGSIPLQGATHGYDLSSLFLIKEGNQNLDPSTDEAKVRKIYTRVLTDFAKTGNTSINFNDNELIWKRYTTDDADYLDINVDISTHKDLYRGRMDFWQSIFML